MQFLYPALTWGFLLVLAPLLIHLINMMRHRRVEWAAMEFLLQSYKKHRKWVWLRQLLLMMARMAIVALLVAMLAQWITRGQWLDLLGGRPTHHYVLLDDSMSMSDRARGTRAFDVAMQFLQRLGAEAADQELPQKFTLLRFSQAQFSNAEDNVIRADMNSEVVDNDFSNRLEQKRIGMDVSQLASRPQPALAILQKLMEQAPDENRIVYLVSDFRENDWGNPEEVKQQLRSLEDKDAKIHLVRCAEQRRANLAITDLRPVEATRAAGVPLFVNVTITNFGDQDAEKVPLQLRTHFYDASPEELSQPTAELDELPTRQIPKIPAGQSVTERMQVFFPRSGKHVVEARLPEDAIAADNRRWCVIDFPDGESVLVLDGDLEQRNAFYLRTIVQPGQRTNTGVRPDIQPPTFLRDATPELLEQYSCVYLFDVERLDERAIRNLETFVSQGGGLGIFVGPRVLAAAYNEQLYRDGQGLMPVPLERQEILEPSPILQKPDVEVDDPEHPILRPLAAGQNPFIRLVRVNQYWQVPEDWSPPADSAVRVLARLRNRNPLAIEHPFGEGRVFTFLSTYAPYRDADSLWNDWALGPNAIMALLLQSRLGGPQRRIDERVVGTPLDLTLAQSDYRAEVRMFAAGEDGETVIPSTLQAKAPATDSPLMAASLAATEAVHSGVYEAWVTRTSGEVEALRFALNVDADDSDLALPADRDLLASLDPVDADILNLRDFDAGLIERAGFNRSLLLLSLLVLFLLLEQFMAYSASYHPGKRANS